MVGWVDLVSRMKTHASRQEANADYSQRTSFIGRARELANLTNAFDTHRLVSLVGPPGIGKTRLARRFLTQTRDLWPGGACFYDLSEVRDIDAMTAAVARALGVPTASLRSHAEIMTGIGAALVARGRTLILLDNLEQLLPTGAGLIHAWLDAAPEARVLATSRELLHLDGERVHEIEPLPEAAQLFIERTRDMRPEYAPDAEEHHAIEEIVTRLDGIPLAIELAAARMRLLSAKDLLARLSPGFDLLTRHYSHGDPRRVALLGSITWSWSLLDPHEQRALAATTVFRGGFTLEAAEHVLEATRAAGAPPALELIQALRDKSLLRLMPSGSPRGALRINTYETIRAFAASRVGGPDALGALRAAHIHYYLALGEAAMRLVPAKGTEPVQAALGPERDNLEAILEHCATHAERGALETAFAVAILLDAVAAGDGISLSQAQLLDAAIATYGDGERTPLLGRALVVRAIKRTLTGRIAEAEADCLAARAIAAAAGDRELHAWAELRLGYTLFPQARLSEALAASSEARVHYRALGNTWGEVQALLQEGTLRQSMNSEARANARLEQALALSRREGILAGELRAESGLAHRALLDARFDEAERRFSRALELAGSLGIRRSAAIIHNYRGIMRFEMGMLDEALTDLDAATVELSPRSMSLLLAAKAAVLATRDEREKAERVATLAAAWIERAPSYRVIAEAYLAHLDLCAYRQALDEGELEVARRHQAVAKARLEAAQAVSMDDALLAARSLALTLGRGPSSVASSRELVVGAGAAWFQLDGGDRVDLLRRKVLRRLLKTLCERRPKEREEPVQSEQLIQEAWPGEKLSRETALNRLRVSVAALRALGLRDILWQRGCGYFIDPGVQITQLSAGDRAGTDA